MANAHKVREIGTRDALREQAVRVAELEKAATTARRGTQASLEYTIAPSSIRDTDRSSCRVSASESIGSAGTTAPCPEPGRVTTTT